MYRLRRRTTAYYLIRATGDVLFAAVIVAACAMVAFVLADVVPSLINM